MIPVIPDQFTVGEAAIYGTLVSKHLKLQSVTLIMVSLQ